MYVDTYLHTEREKKNGGNIRSEKIVVIERIDGKRTRRVLDPIYEFYVEEPFVKDDEIRKKTLFDTWARRYTFQTRKDMKECIENFRSLNRRTFESDIPIVNKILERYYKGLDAPDIYVLFFDIEVEILPNTGFSTPNKPEGRITSISFWGTDTEDIITYALVPDGMREAEVQKEINKYFGEESKYIRLFRSEKKLIQEFLKVVAVYDVISGWNSETYDLPYIIKRFKQIARKYENWLAAFCDEFTCSELRNELKKEMKITDDQYEETDLPGIPIIPVEYRYTKFGKENLSYKLRGKVHLDYLELYKKHTPGEMTSYRLDNIGHIEVGEKKIEYEGSLADLYKNDFCKFLEYNRQDVRILCRLEEKKKFIQLANRLAHQNCVTIPTTMGTVNLVEQAIIISAHEEGLVVPDKAVIRHAIGDEQISFSEKTTGIEEDLEDSKTEKGGYEIVKGVFTYLGKIDLDEKEDSSVNGGSESDLDVEVAGAYVVPPKVGVWNYIGSVDVNSLYPSTIRSLNISPETLVAQLLPTYTEKYIEDKKAMGYSHTQATQDLFGTLEYQMVMEQSDKPIRIRFYDVTNPREPFIETELTGKEVYDIIFKIQGYTFTISANGTIFRQDKRGIIPKLLDQWYRDRKKMQKRSKLFDRLASSGIELPDDILDKL